ncbi:ABC transporter ATP-binding protein [uncultured Lutibacter sp.]|uniref:ABC transporter ATP-binding protein n=1 Tax=Lutibacter sp. TaxID=1925666 RepID=UPI002611F814|nr:ABC transporter ATP-binding protein [uncultured Lutibacter sp.]
MEKKVILQTKKISKIFYQPIKFKALDDISFKIFDSEFITMVGKSGSGKSTLLYILSTMDTDYKGELFINEEKITGQKPNNLATIRNKNIGFVFQFHYLLPEFSCLKNVMIPALKLGILSSKEIEEQAYQKLDLLGIKNQALKPASKLSGGQQQRVAIARALINHPKIIMCDEPTGNLDSKNTSIVLETFHQLSQEFGQTIIAVTHDNDFAKASNRIIEMTDGKLINNS